MSPLLRILTAGLSLLAASAAAADTGLNMDHPNFSPLEGPIAGNHLPMFSNPESRKSMAEGPSLLHHQSRWLLAWDEPAGGGMQLTSSPNLKAWTHLKSATFSPHAQHGTLFLAPRNAVGWLRKLPRQARSGLVPQCHSIQRDRYVSCKFRPFEHVSSL